MARHGTRGDGRFDTGVLFVCVAAALFALIAPGSVRGRVADGLRDSILVPFVRLEGRASAARSALRVRDAVLVSRGRAVTDTLALRAVADENASLRRLLGLAARLQDGFVPAEVLPLRIGEEFTLGLTAGSDAGVQRFLPVVTANGLIGMIDQVDRRMSTAITWAHPDFRVSAMSVDEQAFGIVQPHLGAGAERWLLELRGVPFREKLDTGTLIVSSGLGSTYPRGLPLGTIMGELSTPEKWARTYLVKPAVLSDATGPVLILMPARARQGVNGVWTSVAAADSAARAVAAAGDSVAREATARDAALREVAARRAVLDSLVTDSVAADSAARLRTPPDTSRWWR